MDKKILLGASYSLIEPLGCFYLASIAKQEGWQPKIFLAKDSNLKDLDSFIERFNPDMVGFSLYTGNHVKSFEYFDSLRKKNPKIKIILGGPHATYFPQESIKHSDFVVLSEGLNGLRRILRNEVQPGIIHLKQTESFPIPDRRDFYNDFPDHKRSAIKSITTQTGCPYSCSYCYNSSSFEEIADFLKPNQKKEMKEALAPLNRLFPKKIRPVEDIIKEISDLKEFSPETKMIYFQDDVFGADLEWVKKFSKIFPALGLQFHAQMRFERADPNNTKNKEILELMRESGCTGLTFAIESANPVIRKEVLHRNMNEDLMFRVLNFLNNLGYNVRTEQMLGLPYGATTQETKVNLEADLETLELNVKLRDSTGLPTMAWASIFAPYIGTKIGEYCSNHGFYSGSNNDVPTTFFERSVLNFPKKWVGPELSGNKKNLWLSKEELTKYKDDLQMLRDLFTLFAFIPRGHKLARDFLENPDKSYHKLSTLMRRHLYNHVLYNLE